MRDPDAALLPCPPSGFYTSAEFLERIAGDVPRPLDRDVARENLLRFREALAAEGVAFVLFFGTLLGAVREGDFIAHDFDTDVVLLERDLPALLRAAPRLVEAGFAWARYKRGGRFLTFMRCGEYIDAYTAVECRRFPYRRCLDVDGVLLPRHLLEGRSDIPFLGRPFSVPARHEEVLAAIYGATWRRPRRDAPSRASLDLLHPRASAAELARRLLRPRVRLWLKRLAGRS